MLLTTLADSNNIWLLQPSSRYPNSKGVRESSEFLILNSIIPSQAHGLRNNRKTSSESGEL